MVTKDRKVFFLYTLCIAVLIAIGFSILYLLNSKENYYIVVRIYNFVEYSFLAYFFSLHIQQYLIKKLLLISPLIFLPFCIFNFVASKPEIPFVPLAVEYVILLIFITYFFFELMQNTTTVPVYQKAFFWISAAFILNFSGNLFLFLFSKNSYNDEVFQRHYTIIYTTVTVLKNILLCISAVIKEKQEISISNPFNHPDFEDLHQFKN